MDNVSTSNLDHLLQSVSYRTVILRFSYFFLPILILLVSGYFYLHYIEHSQRLSIRMTEEVERINLARNVLAYDLNILASDLSLLSHSEELTTLLQKGGEKNLRRLQQRFLYFSRDRKLYDQIRLIDEKGMETLRVNMNGRVSTIVPEGELQNKSDRYYFTHTVKQQPGTQFISPLDLNIEHGKVEQPIKPVVRVATRLSDLSGNSRGIIILNYLASRMLERAQNSLSQNSNVIYGLVNSSGSWLNHPDKSLRWGFMFGRRSNFGDQFPDVWRQIKSQSQGQISSGDGLFTFTKVYPHEEMTGERDPSINSDDPSAENSWTIIGQLPARYVVFHPLDHLHGPLPAIFLMIMAMAALGTWQLIRANSIRRQWTSLTNLLFLAIEQSPAAIIVTDSDGNIEYANQRFSLVSSYPLKSVIGENPRILKSGEKSEEEYKELWDVITSGRTWHGEFHNKRSDGSFYWAEARISPVTDDKGHIGHYIGIQEDITEKRRLQSELEMLANTDPLTGLNNRRCLCAQGGAEIARCRRHGHDLAIMMLDLDYFKAINDTWGHAVGDYVLQEFAGLLQESARESDILGRFGGEEFVIIMPATVLEQALEFAERLRIKVEKLPFKLNDALNITVSIGCAQFQQDDKDIDEPLDRADKALYRAKQSGRNRVCD
ncbi:MAG: diguanylate cyclase [Sedimenticola sp.]